MISAMMMPEIAPAPATRTNRSTILMHSTNVIVDIFSSCYVADRVGFEPTELLHPPVFETGAINLSTTYPKFGAD
jgi:hypothetical protein